MRKEQTIHRTVVRHLVLRGSPGVVWFHPPNGGYRRPVEAKILNGLGVKAGVSDLIFLHQGRFFALELKADKGRTTPAQREFIESVKLAGGSGEVAHGLDNALKVLENWGLLQGRIQ